MLYDVIPPSLFVLSLGGVLVIVARASVRLRKAAASADVRSLADQAAQTNVSPGKTLQMLRPNGGNVQAIRSRAALIRGTLGGSFRWLMGLPSSLMLSLRERRARKAEAVLKTEAVPESSVGETTEQVPEVGTVVAPRRRFAERLRSAASGGLHGTGQKLRGVTQQHFSIRRLRQPETPSEEELLDSGTNTEPQIHMRVIEDQPAPTGVLQRPVAAVASAVRGRAAQTHRQEPSPKLTPVQLASQALQAGNYQKAEDLLVSYIVKHTKDTKAYMLLGEAALGRQSWDEALEIFEQVVSWNPEQRGVYAGLGCAAYRAGKYTRALQALHRAHEAEPDNLEVLQNLLVIAQRMDNRALQHSTKEKMAEREARLKNENGVATPA